ncbi:MAG: molybdate ABC transporter permease subunit [Anaerolineales bacterium]|nr:molybdate ABC transporter permease subunit [Anaerolineales bacterium]
MPPAPPNSRSAAWSERALWLSTLPLLAFLALPIGALIYRASLGGLAAALNSGTVGQALQLSLLTTLTTTGLTILFGTPVGYLLARREFRLKRVVDTLLDLPSVLPPSVAGIALLITFGRRGVLGAGLSSWGLTLAFTTAAVVMAQLFIAVPFYVRAAMLGLESIEPELEQAAALDGASRWQTFRFVTVPLAWPALVSGAVMTWARALGEFGATIIFAGNFAGRTQTMPLAIYLGFETDLDVALALSVILVGLAALALILVKGVLHREWR